MKFALKTLLTFSNILALASTCHGMMTFQLSGYISELNTNEDTTVFNLGQSWTIEIDYDENASDSNEWSPGIDSDETKGKYTNAIISFRFTSGDFILDASGGSINISNNVTFTDVTDEWPTEDDTTFVGDSMTFQPDLDENASSSPILIESILSFSMSFFDRDADVFDSDALPISTPELEDFDSALGKLYWWPEASEIESISITTTSMSLVPEPTTFAIAMGLTSLMATFIYRARSRH
jgi:hypothetical protein